MASSNVSLRSGTLGELDRRADKVGLPEYERDTLRQGIVHIGVGGFHRAHLATYADELAKGGNSDWAILGAGVRSDDAAMRDALVAQDGLYTLISRGPHKTVVEVIGSITGYVHAHPDVTALIEAIAAPTTQILSLTITEGGYPISDSTGDFTAAEPDSTFDIIARGLDSRRRKGNGPLTILSCDNIMSNGRVAKTATVGAAMGNDELVTWIDAEVSFPNSMVDRITPATVESDRSWLAESHNIEDLWPVVAEPFRQWVVEDNFAGDRPPLEDLDVIVTTDVEPYEHMKLRLLNASHSCLSYLAALDGITTVDAAMANTLIRSFVASFLEREASPVLPPVEHVAIDEYNASLIERFSNPAISDQISRLCLDGSAKFPKFLLPTIRAQIRAGGPIKYGTLALAGWCHYLNGTDCHGQPIDVARDPNLAEAKQYAAASLKDPAAFLSFSLVFGDIGENSEFRNEFVASLETLRNSGVPAALARCLGTA